MDWEWAELGVVIGKRCKNVTREKALEYVLGYTCVNDVSARDWQRTWGGSQWGRGKSFDTFCPMGPAIVTADEIPNPNALRLQLLRNGEVMQDSNTRDMIFDVPAADRVFVRFDDIAARNADFDRNAFRRGDGDETAAIFEGGRFAGSGGGENRGVEESGDSRTGLSVRARRKKEAAREKISWAAPRCKSKGGRGDRLKPERAGRSRRSELRKALGKCKRINAVFHDR